jgi:hypothetical protein
MTTAGNGVRAHGAKAGVSRCMIFLSFFLSFYTHSHQSGESSKTAPTRLRLLIHQD